MILGVLPGPERVALVDLAEGVIHQGEGGQAGTARRPKAGGDSDRHPHGPKPGTGFRSEGLERGPKGSPAFWSNWTKGGTVSILLDIH